jgi:carbon storage regulator
MFPRGNFEAIMFPQSLFQGGITMLVLTRKLNETIVIDGLIRVTVLGIMGNKMRIGVSAPEHIQVDREEIAQRRLVLNVPEPCVIRR